MKITKILASEATPAKAILNRAQHVALTSAQRKNLPDAIELDGQSIEVSVADKRALSVGDVLLDESGHFYVIEAAPENILLIKGDEEFAAEAAVALLNRGIEVAQVEGGFAIAKDEQLQQLLTDAGLEFEEVQLPFDPIKVPKHHAGCCCGHHHHEHGEGCGCGKGHHHHHEEGECCCGGHHEAGHAEGCGCDEGHHHHHHDDGQCCCGGHHHDDDHGEGCACGGKHHHHGDTCGCGHHHDDGCDCETEHHHQHRNCKSLFERERT